MRILFDTSALLKRYLPESGREAVLALVAQARPAVAAPHCKVELYSALNRLRRETREAAADQSAYRQTCDEIERNFAEMDVLPFTSQLERHATQALEAAPMRAMGALHVAAAALARVDLFVTADIRQHQGARALGLKATLL